MDRSTIKRKMRNFLSIRVVYHSIFWICYYSFMVFMRYLATDSIGESFKDATQLASFDIVLVYINFFLIEKLLYRKKYLRFTGVFLLYLTVGCVLFVIFFTPEFSLRNFASSLYALMSIIILTSAIKFSKKGLIEHLDVQEIKEKQLETELKLLKSQVNPHFFFNTLNSLYALSLNQSKDVPDAILKLSNLMRYLLESAKKKEVYLEEECSFIRDYISLEEMRYSNNCEIKLDIKGDIENKSIAPMLLIPFVENSFKHGASAKAYEAYVHIALNIENKRLLFEVKNSRKNSDIEEQTVPSSGLDNIRRRLQLLYPNKHKLKINEPEGAFEVYLEVGL